MIFLYLLAGPFALLLVNGFDRSTLTQSMIGALCSLAPLLVGLLILKTKGKPDALSLTAIGAAVLLWFFLGLVCWGLTVT